MSAIFLGDTGIGKSTFLTSVSEGRNIAVPRPTIGVDSIIYRTNKHTLRCWDTGGSARFMHVIPLFARECDVAVYMFDARKPHTFANINKWRELISTVEDAPQEHVAVALHATGPLPLCPDMVVLDGRHAHMVMDEIIRRGVRTHVSFDVATPNPQPKCCFRMC